MKTPADTQTPTPDILQLDAKPGSACQPADCEHFGEPRLSCSPEFADILYSTRDDPLKESVKDEKAAFWLLPGQVANTIRKTTRELSALLSPEKAADERVKGMDASELLEYFLVPRLSLFLVGEQKVRMQSFEEREPYLAESARFELAMLKSLSPLQLSQPANRNRLKQLDEWDQLRKLAIHNAERQGYAYRDGALFTPQAEEVRALLTQYNSARQQLVEQGSPTFTSDELANFLGIAKLRLLEASDCTVNCKAPIDSYLKWRKQHPGELAYLDYTNAILALANYSLALPEFALSGNDQAGLHAGVERFLHYWDLQKRQYQIEEAMRGKHKDWLGATGKNIPLPSGLFDEEKAQWDALETERSQLESQARSNVAQAKQRRYLLWEPETYQPAPVDRLVKTGFPLREVSLPGTPGEALHHLSLKMLKDLVPEKVTFAGNSSGKQATDQETSDFHDWLVREGAVRIDAQGEWFDQEGWFDGEAFQRYLKAHHYQVKSLANEQARSAWTEQLRQILFKADAQRSLRLFDNSPQAQLVRCLTPPQAMMQIGASWKGSVTSISGNISMDINLARGEVEIFDLDLPERDKAKNVTLPYQLNGDPTSRSLDIGRFSAHLSARAWGFAGASFLLSGSLGIRPGNLAYGASLDPIQPATRDPSLAGWVGNSTSNPVLQGRAANARIEDGAKAEFNLFAGVQAGILTTGALNWAPPTDRPAYLMAPNPSGQPVSEWLSLARLQLGLAGAGGLGGGLSAGLSLSRGCLMLHLKAELIAGPGAKGDLSFAVGYEAIGEILDIVRRELHNNQQRKMQWITDDAMSLLAKLNVSGALGIDVGMLYLLNLSSSLTMGGLRIADVVMSLYEAITSGGRGGLVAYSIMTYKKPDELKRWVVECIPEGLGPLLMTLISRQAITEVAGGAAEDLMKTIGLGNQSATQNKVKNSGEQNEEGSYDPQSAPLYQQQALERILGWIVEHAGANPEKISDAQRQFDSACSRMNKFGSYEYKGQVYCDNRDQMDKFMKSTPDVAGGNSPANTEMRAKYLEHVKILGALRDDYCKPSDFSGTTYLPGGQNIYTGPGV
ncbi:hypothetical protein [Pseudomonas nicosulfuronedens]